MRRGPSWHSAKEAPQLDLNGGKCSENAQLSNRTIIVFLGDLGGILQLVKVGPHFTKSTKSAHTRLQHLFGQLSRKLVESSCVKELKVSEA